MRGRAVLVLAAALATIATANPQPRLEQKVMVGGTAEFDACPSNARVKRLNPKGDNFLSVRSRPSVKGRELAQLKSGQDVWACDETRDGEWTGIVYAPLGADISCGVGTPIARRQPYSGSCQTGWVASRYIDIIAG